MLSRTPLGSTRPICWPWRVKATGLRSTTFTRIWSGRTRITVARSTQGISSNCLRRSPSGTKKTFRPISSPKTGSISARLTWLKPVASMLLAPAMRKRASRARYVLNMNVTVTKLEKTIRAPTPRKTRPTVLSGRHQGFCCGRKRRPPKGYVSSPSASAISSGIPGRLRPDGGTPSRTRRNWGSVGASSSQSKGRFELSFCRLTPEQGRENRQAQL